MHRLFNAVKIHQPHDGRPITDQIGYTGDPRHGRISGSMQHDITFSVGGTALDHCDLLVRPPARQPMLWC